MIILFDVDGVLVQHRAYHLGLSRTVGYFSQRLGVPEQVALTQAEIDEFEAQSVTVEWESSAISVAALVLARLRAEAGAGKPAGEGLPAFWQAVDALGAQPPRAGARPDFSALARQVGARASSRRKPAHIALELLEAESAGAAWADTAQPLLRQLLADCYAVDFSPTHQVVQNYALGHAGYAAVYQLPPHFEHPALLETEDRPFLQPAWRDRLLAERAAGRLYFTLYTARPSLPPVEVTEPQRGYTPEAEMALTLVGLERAGPARVPIMGVGRLEWVARLSGRSAMEWVKPSPIHALAGLAAAHTRRELDAVYAAVAVEAGQALPALYTDCAGEHVHVFEDSASSLRGVTRAVEMLNAHGLGLTLTRHGIAPAGSSKHAALSQVADYLHADVNAGLQMIL